MDPEACLARLKEALAAGDMDEVIDAAEDLREWIRKGGAPPKEFPADGKKPFTVVIRTNDDEQQLIVEYEMAETPEAATAKTERDRWGEDGAPPLYGIVFAGHVKHVYGD